MGDMTVADVLERAADLIEPEGAWTQHWFAKDELGNEIPELSPEATCWCAIGAVFVAAGKAERVGSNFLCAVIDAKDIGQFECWNDDPDRTQPEVVAKLREAAALAREQGL